MTGQANWRCGCCHRYQPEKRKTCGNCRHVRGNAAVWYAVWYESCAGRRIKRYERIGPSPTSTQAHERLGAVRDAQAMQMGIPGAADAGMTVGELSRWYLALPDVMEMASYPDVVRHLEHACTVLGDGMRVADLSQASVRAVKANTRTTATANRRTASLSAMLHRAKRDGLIVGLNLPVFETAHEASRNRILSVEEEAALWAVLPHPAESPVTAMILLARYTGMRQGEIAGLQAHELSLSEALIRLPAERTKEGKAKVIPLVIQARDGTLIDHALWALKCRPRAFPGTRVFSDGPKDGLALYRAFKRACKDAGIAGMRFHDLRRCFCVWMVLGMGYDRRVVKAITGHSTDRAFDSYRTDREREAVSVMGQRSPWAGEWDADPVRAAWRVDRAAASSG